MGTSKQGCGTIKEGIPSLGGLKTSLPSTLLSSRRLRRDVPSTDSCSLPINNTTSLKTVPMAKTVSVSYASTALLVNNEDRDRDGMKAKALKHRDETKKKKKKRNPTGKSAVSKTNKNADDKKKQPPKGGAIKLKGKKDRIMTMDSELSSSGSEDELQALTTKRQAKTPGKSDGEFIM